MGSRNVRSSAASYHSFIPDAHFVLYRCRYTWRLDCVSEQRLSPANACRKCEDGLRLHDQRKCWQPTGELSGPVPAHVIFSAQHQFLLLT